MAPIAQKSKAIPSEVSKVLLTLTPHGFCNLTSCYSPLSPTHSLLLAGLQTRPPAFVLAVPSAYTSLFPNSPLVCSLVSRRALLGHHIICEALASDLQRRAFPTAAVSTLLPGFTHLHRNLKT